MRGDSRCFVSSSVSLLETERMVVMDSLMRLGLTPVAMEYFPADSRPRVDIVKQLVKSCDMALIVFGNELGKSSHTDKYKNVEEEYNFIQTLNLPVFVFIQEKIDTAKPSSTTPQFRQFKKILQQKHKPELWRSSEDLKNSILISLSYSLSRKGKRYKSGINVEQKPNIQSSTTLLSPVSKPSDLIEKYLSLLPNFYTATENLELRLQETLRGQLSIDKELEFTIFSRTKTPESFREKLSRPSKGSKYLKLSDVCDLSAARIVLFHESEVEIVKEIIIKTFNGANVEIKKPENPLEFGYKSVHVLIPLEIEGDGDPAYRAEIQIRTFLQHVWAQIEHQLGYKAETYDNESKRLFAQVSALLEIADTKFSELRNRQQSSKEMIPFANKEGTSKTTTDAFAVALEINEDTLYGYFQSDIWLDSAFLQLLLEENFAFEFFFDTNRTTAKNIRATCELLANSNHYLISQFHDFVEKNAQFLVNVFLEICKGSDTQTLSPMEILWICALAAKAKSMRPKDRPDAELRSLMDEYEIFPPEDRDLISRLFIKKNPPLH